MILVKKKTSKQENPKEWSNPLEKRSHRLKSLGLATPKQALSEKKERIKGKCKSS